MRGGTIFTQPAYAQNAQPTPQEQIQQLQMQNQALQIELNKEKVNLLQQQKQMLQLKLNHNDEKALISELEKVTTVRIDYLESQLNEDHNLAGWAGVFIALITLMFGLMSSVTYIFSARKAEHQVDAWVKEEAPKFVDDLTRQIVTDLTKDKIKQIEKLVSDSKKHLSAIQKHEQDSKKAKESIDKHLVEIGITKGIPEDQRDDLSEATQISKLKSDDEKSYEEHFAEGLDAHYSDEFTEAIKSFEYASKISKVNKAQVAMALFNKAVVYGKMNDPKEAISIYEDIVQRYSDEVDVELKVQVAKALLNKAVTYGKIDNPKEAISIYEDIVQRYSDEADVELKARVADALFNKAVSYEKIGKFEEAISIYENIVQRYSDEADVELKGLVA